MVATAPAAATRLVDVPARISSLAAHRPASRPCLGCGHDQVVTLSARLRDRDEFSVVGCPRCGLSHLEPFPTQVGAYYQRTYREETDPDILAVRAGCAEDNDRRCEALMAHLGRRECRLLDLGCGSGVFLHAARQRGRAQLFGVEPHDAFRAYLRNEGFDVRQGLAAYDSASFDVILLSHVLEHFEAPIDMLVSLRRYLVPRGLVVIEVPSLTDALLWLYRIPAFWRFYWQFPHIWYFSPEPLQRVIEQAGYRVESLRGMQRYGLRNHLQWLNEGTPGKGEQFAPLVSEAMDAQYREALVANEAFDTIWMEGSPTSSHRPVVGGA